MGSAPAPPARTLRTLRGALIVCGEPSGDRAAARVAAHLHEAGVTTFGLGGAACERAGVELCARAEDHGAMGLLDVAGRAASVVRGMTALRTAARARRPGVALLVNYTEFNTRLAAFLRRAGVRVVWYAAPQIWAWRPGRARALARWVDAMAVVLPFEEALWRARGVDAKYVGHPSFETASFGRTAARARLGIAERAVAVAILPGSRAKEVRRLVGPMLQAVERVRQRGAEPRLLLSESLDGATRRSANALAKAARIVVYDVAAADGAAPLLAAFDASLCASGTASLEAAVANAPPVVAYRTDALTALMGRALLRTPHVALPNVLLGRRAFPELLQRHARSSEMAAALERMLDARDEALADCHAVRSLLGEAHKPSQKVAEMACAWL